MPPKGEETREMILRKASRLFNERGYDGASVSDVMAATGLQKGGLYNHFGSKEDLAVESFNYSVQQVHNRIAHFTNNKKGLDKLYGVIDMFESYYDDPPVPGGCPIMNMAVESDDAHPRLRERARSAMNDYFENTRRLVQSCVQHGEMRSNTDPAQVAMVLLTMFEGALVLSRLHQNRDYLLQATAFMRKYVEGFRP